MSNFVNPIGRILSGINADAWTRICSDPRFSVLCNAFKWICANSLTLSRIDANCEADLAGTFRFLVNVINSRDFAVTISDADLEALNSGIVEDVSGMMTAVAMYNAAHTEA